MQDALNGLSDTSVTLEDGKLSCTFTREAVTNLILPMGLGEATIDLNSEPYFIQLATGLLDSSDNIAYHQDKIVSKKAFIF